MILPQGPHICDIILKLLISFLETVTCQFTVDNELNNVSFNGEALSVTGDLDDWKKEKVVTFSPGSDDHGELRIEAEDWNNQEHCIRGGLLLQCQSTDPNSLWHNFKSDTDHWRALDGSELCTNNEGFAAAEDVPFVRSMLASGSKKIWTNNKEVTLIGNPTSGESYLIILLTSYTSDCL